MVLTVGSHSLVDASAQVIADTRKESVLQSQL